MKPVSACNVTTVSEISSIKSSKIDSSKPSSSGWHNSEHPLVPAPLRVVQVRPIENKSLAVEPKKEIPKKPEQKVGKFRKAITLTGITLCSVGTVAGLISITFLGPLGLAVAAGAAVLGGTLIALGTVR